MRKISQNIIPLEIISLVPPLWSFLNLLKRCVCFASSFLLVVPYTTFCVFSSSLNQIRHCSGSLYSYAVYSHSSYVWKCFFFFFMSIFGELWGCLFQYFKLHKICLIKVFQTATPYIIFRGKVTLLPFTASLNALRGQKAICEIGSHIWKLAPLSHILLLWFPS